MIYITQLIYLKPGKEDVFESFETVAIPLIARYNGRMILRVRPSSTAFIDGETSRPYEIHLVTFEAESDFEAFARDPERASFLHLKEASVDRIVLIKGIAL